MMQKFPISPKTMLTQNEKVFSAEMGEEFALLNVETGNYYVLDEIGGRIFSLLEKPCSYDELQCRLIEEFEVTAEQCIEDTRPFLEKMIAQQIVKILE